MTFVRIVLLAGSIWALQRELAGMGPGALLHRLARYGWTHVTLGLAGTALSFLLLGALELLTLRATESESAAERVPAGAAFGTAFVANAFGQSIGLAVLTGAAVRSRAYSRRGMDATAVARLSGMVMISVVLGLLSVGAWALLVTAAPITVASHQYASRPLGTVLGVIVLAYVAWTFREPVDTATHSRWRIAHPTSRVAIAQIALASADWLVTGAVLYVFLPAGLTAGVWPFLAMYAIAQVVAMVSHVPAGAGVLEIMLLGLVTADAPPASRAALLAAIIMFRAVYYLLPLCVAMLVAAGAELRRSRRRALRHDPRPGAVLVNAPASTHA